jgi:hypothetical protein
MGLFYCAYRYNIFFVTDANIDTKGLIYPRALQQLMTGVYIAELCLIGLFGIAAAVGPIILMVAFLVFTALFHISLNAALDPLLYNLPKTLEAEEESIRGLLSAETDQHNGTGAARIDSDPKDSEVNEKNNKVVEAPAPTKKPNFISKFFAPHIYSDYASLRQMVPHNLLDADHLYEEAVERNAYFPPSVTAEVPLLWIPRDDAGVSRQEIVHTSKVIPITDEGCTFDEKNKLVWDTETARPPLWQEKIYY